MISFKGIHSWEIKVIELKTNNLNHRLKNKIHVYMYMLTEKKIVDKGQHSIYKTLYKEHLKIDV